MPQLSRHTDTSLSDINIVPFVDVMLVLLIIFMITAPILQSGIEVSVPKTRTVREIAEQRLVVTINKSQLVYLGNDAININELGSKVRAQMTNPQSDAIYLRSDESVPFGTVATVMDALLQSGITNISVVTEPLTTTRSN